MDGMRDGRRRFLIMATVSILVPVLGPWILLWLGIPLYPGQHWGLPAGTMMFAVWTLPFLALLATAHRRSWGERLLPLLGSLIIMPSLLLLSFFGHSCAIGASIARFDGAPELGRVQVVMCTMIMINWDRVQQQSTIPWFGRTVVTFGPMEDGSSLPVDPSFRWLSNIDLVILEGNEYSRETIGRFDVAAFEVLDGGRLRYLPIPADRGRTGVRRAIRGSDLAQRHDQIGRIIQERGEEPREVELVPRPTSRPGRSRPEVTPWSGCPPPVAICPECPRCTPTPRPMPGTPTVCPSCRSEP